MCETIYLILHNYLSYTSAMNHIVSTLILGVLVAGEDEEYALAAPPYRTRTHTGIQVLWRTHLLYSICT